MGSLKLMGDHVVREGAPPYRLPEKLSDAFITALVGPGPGEEGFIGELSAEFLGADKKRLFRESKAIGGTLWDLYRSHACRWASVLNDNNKWTLADFTMVYIGEIPISYVNRVMISDKDMRFVHTTAGDVYTFSEFRWRHGRTVVDEIETSLEIAREKIEDVLEIIQSELISHEVSLVTPDGKVQSKILQTLAALPRDRWVLPDGYKLLCVNE